MLIDAATDRPVPGRKPLRGTQSVDLAAIGTRQLSVQAFLPAKGTRSVRFNVDGRTTSVESASPFVLAGDSTKGDIYAWKPTPGKHTIVITPYSGRNGTGRAGTPLRIALAVTDTAGGAAAKPHPSKPAGEPVTPKPAGKPVATPTMPPTTGRYLYVSGSGDDKSTGTSAAKPLRTLQKAANMAKAGDTVLVMNGTYANSDPNSNILTVSRGGAQGRPLTIAAYPGHTPVLRARNWNAVQIHASHVIVRDLTIEGNRNEITLAQALAQKTNRNNPLHNGNGIIVQPPRDNLNRTPHHVTIRGNTVRNTPGGGIAAIETDHVTIEKNTVSGTSHWTVYGTSGISVFHSRDVDGDTTGYKMIVRQNVVFDNRNFVPWIDSSRDPSKRHITDGNGIIIDDNRNTQIAHRAIQPYRGRILVENNIAYRNGGGGVHIFLSDRVDVVNNTAYRNSTSPEIGDRDISAIRAHDVRYFNNVAVSAPGHKPMAVSRTPGRAKGTETVIDQCNLFGGDPRFVDPDAGDFRLRAGSPAIDAACGPAIAKTDVAGKARPSGKAADKGARES
ncbi:right-handed parallel beta-helix repeat-containing protein [Actinoplanes sp. NPDC049118]|uniref:right-handed parallel beta-helix repeat-containing protein n=1 Tax=Actinoplanes sp. NPDC049118 TaxID=3155769 RepID=UPI0033FFE8DD